MAERPFRVDDRFSFRLGASDIQGIVTEDRGPIGVGGRHLYGVKFSFSHTNDEPAYVELPAVDMKLIEPATPTRRKHRRKLGSL